jgi:LysR family cys regulon transcriptional activator
VNLHQFRFIQEAVRQELNLTETAKALHTSQPGISKAILDLEAELGVDIFARHGKRLRRVTEPGQQVLQSVEIIMREVHNLKRIGEEFSAQDAGTLSIATTHTQARYVLPQPVATLRQRHPRVQVELHQGTPDQVARMLIDETAVIGLATESLDQHEELLTLPCYEWQHVVVVPSDHALAGSERLTLEDLARHPLVTYHPSVAGRSRIDAAFARAGLRPTVALEALDSDVIKTYTRVGLGVGIVAEMAVREDFPDLGLVALPAGHLFGANVSRIAFRKGVYLRQFVLTFASLLSDRLTPDLIRRLTAGSSSTREA